MENEVSEDKVEEVSEEKKPVKKTTSRKPRATKKVAEESPVEVVNVVVEEAKVSTEEGQEVITGPKKPKPARASNMNSKEDNTLSSRAADAALAKKTDATKEEPEKEKVALWSEKNIRWSGVGTLTKGYNIVDEEAAEQWVTKAGIRKATPQEVATHYGK